MFYGDIPLQDGPDRLYSDARSLVNGITESTGRDRREGETFEVMQVRNFETAPIAACQQFTLTATFTAIDRPDGVDHVFRGQIIPLGNFGVSGLAAAQRAAFLNQLRTRGAVDSSIHTAAAQKRRIRSIDDSVDLHLRDVALNDRNVFQRSDMPLLFDNPCFQVCVKQPMKQMFAGFPPRRQPSGAVRA